MSTRYGLWFQVPADGHSFEITGLRVPTAGSPAPQHVAVKRFAATPPSGVGTLLFSALSQTGNDILPCSVSVAPGDIICVLGERSSLVPPGLWFGNYSRGQGGFASQAAGNPITLFGCSALSMPFSGGAHVSVTDLGTSELGRVEVYVRATGRLAAKSTYGIGCLGLSHDASARPVVGTTFNLVTTNLPSQTIVGATILGLTRRDPGIDLTAIGMPGCSQYNSFEVVGLWTPTSSTVGQTPFTLPNDPAIAGVELLSQGAAYGPGINAAGAVTSNGLSMRIDIN